MELTHIKSFPVSLLKRGRVLQLLHEEIKKYYLQRRGAWKLHEQTGDRLPWSYLGPRFFYRLPVLHQLKSSSATSRPLPSSLNHSTEKGTIKPLVEDCEGLQMYWQLVAWRFEHLKAFPVCRSHGGRSTRAKLTPVAVLGLFLRKQSQALVLLLTIDFTTTRKRKTQSLWFLFRGGLKRLAIKNGREIFELIYVIINSFYYYLLLS